MHRTKAKRKEGKCHSLKVSFASNKTSKNDQSTRKYTIKLKIKEKYAKMDLSEIKLLFLRKLSVQLGDTNWNKFKHFAFF